MSQPTPRQEFSRWRAKVKPLPGLRARLAFARRFAAGEWAEISQGLVPRGMEDKWFIFAEADILRLVRSWTGFCIFELQTRATDRGDRVVDSAWVNCDPVQYHSGDVEYDAALLAFLIDHLLLGRPRPFPLPRSEIPSPVPGAGLFQHHIAGTGVPEVEYPWKSESDPDLG